MAEKIECRCDEIPFRHLDEDGHVPTCPESSARRASDALDIDEAAGAHTVLVTKPDHGFTTDGDRQLAADQAREHLAELSELLGERHDAEVAALRARMAELEASLAAGRQELADMTANFHAIEDLHDRARLERDDAQETADDLKRALAGMTAERDEWRRKYDDLEANISDEEDGLRGERDSLRTQLSAADIANGKLTRANARLHARCLRLLKERKGGTKRKPTKRAKAKR